MRALELEGVVKALGHREVLHGVDLQLDAGEIVWLAGRNGSGKSTLLKVAADLTPVTRGVVRWFGAAPTAHLRTRIGVLLDASFLYGEMTAEENLIYYARLYGLEGKQKRVLEWLERFRLHRDRGVPIKTFSKGMRQRLAIARACLHEPQLLLLDEPYDGLDAAGSQILTEWLRTLQGAGTGVLLVSHAVAPFQDLTYRTLRLEQGRLYGGGEP